jgi:hypothetical protein
MDPRQMQSPELAAAGSVEASAGSSVPTATTLMWSDGGIAMACSGQVAIIILRQPATVALLKRVRGDMTRLKARFSGQLMSLVILESGAVRDTPAEVRAEATNLMKDAHVLAAAIVIEGNNEGKGNWHQAQARADRRCRAGSGLPLRLVEPIGC